MSGLPPLSAEPGTPAAEWAAKTTTALEPNPGTPPTRTMNPTTRQLFEEKNLRPGTVASDPLANPPTSTAQRTPSQEVPGAFPSDAVEPEARGGQEIMQNATDTANRVAQTVQETAAVYLPKAAETIGQYLPKGVVDTMSTYMPGVSNPQGAVVASEHDHIHAKSLPSTELTGGAGERSEGVGALPGPVTEGGVAKLPDERNASWQIPTTAGAAATATAAAAGAVEAAKQKSTAIAPGPVGGLSTMKYSLPSEEEQGAKSREHVGGVGALPGRRSEPGVATFPDENMRGSTNATSSSVGTHGRMYDGATLPSQNGSTGVSGGVGSLPGTISEEGVALLPEERSDKGATGTALWADKPQSDSPRSTGLDKHVGEDVAMADAAKKASVDSQQQQSAPKPPSKEAKDASQDSAPKKESKPAHKGMPNKEQLHPPKHLPDARSGPGEAARDEKPKEEHSDEEREDELRADLRHLKLEPRTHALGSAGATWGGVDVGSDSYKRGVDVDIDDGDGYDTDYHPAELHPANADNSEEHAQQEKEKEPAAEKDNEKPSTDAKHSEGTNQDDGDQDPEKTKKASFMTKMKGEAKILLGKVEGKKGHDKVEEGQRMKAGETVQ